MVADMPTVDSLGKGYGAFGGWELTCWKSGGIAGV